MKRQGIREAATYEIARRTRALCAHNARAQRSATCHPVSKGSRENGENGENGEKSENGVNGVSGKSGESGENGQNQR